MLLNAGLAPAYTEAPIQINLFGLYQAQSMLIQPAGSSPLIVEMNGSREFWYPQSRAALEIRRREDKLQAEFIGGNRQARALTVTSQINLESAVASDSPIWRVTLDGGRLVRMLQGRLRFRIVHEAIQLVLEADRESVVARVVASEMSGITELEALKALAVVARTFIMASRSRHQSEGFDFCDTTHCQWYQGEDRLNRQDRFSHLVKQAVTGTENLVMSFQGVVRPTYFTGSCGGISAAPETIWGQAASPDAARYPSVSCHWCQASKFYRWQRRVDKAAFRAVVSELTGFMPSSHAEVVPEVNADGFVPAVWVIDGKRRIRLAGDALRSQVGRRLGWNWILSNAYTIEGRGGWLVFRGRGFGHNVGLCLSGAAAQARAGRGYEEILGHYFPGAELIKSADLPQSHKATKFHKGFFGGSS